MAEDALVVLTTFADINSARSVVRKLVEEHLVACGNIIPGVESIYRWQGKIETSTEALVIFKTSVAKYWALEARLKALHPYEVPEILAFRAHEGSFAYLAWLTESLN